MMQLFRKISFLLSFMLLPFAAFAAESPAHVEGATTITADQAYELFEQNVLFVDVRKPSDYESGRIPGAVHLDIKTNFTPDTLAAVSKPADTIVIYCNGYSCMRSSQATAMAVEWGYTNIQYLREGFPSWDEAGFPVE